MESAIEKTVNECAKRNGWLARKFVSPGNAGVPDHLYVRDGVTIYVEFKAPGEALSPQQVLQIKRFKKYGARVFVINNKVMGKHLFNVLLNILLGEEGKL